MDEEKYKAFLSDYIIASGEMNVPSYAQIADHIMRKYGVLNDEKDKIFR